MVMKEPDRIELQPMVVDKNIENESWWDKIARGWRYSAEGLWNGVTGFLGEASETVGNAIDYTIKDPAGAATYLAQNTINTIYYTASGQAAMDLGNLIIAGAHAYGKALQEDPVGTLAKTAIVVGGIAAAIPTGGTSLVVAGAAVAAIGGGTLLVKDSYEYANAKTEVELEALGNENSEDIVWIAGAAVSSAQAARVARAASVDVEYTVTTSQMKNIGKDVWGEEFSSPAFITKNTQITGDLSGKQIALVKNVDDPIFIEHPKTVTAHELFGEAAVENGAIKLPEWINTIKDKNLYGLLRDMAVDSVVAKFIGKEALVNAGHNWWSLYPDLMLKISQEVTIAPWYHGIYGPYISGGLTSIEVMQTG